MNVNRVLEVRDGDAVDSIRGFLTNLWDLNSFDILLAPLEETGGDMVSLQTIEDRSGLERVNPFAPIMFENAARFASESIQNLPGKKIAVLLKPCELRAFVEIRKRKNLPLDRSSVVILGVDCIGTISVEDYSQVKESSSLDKLTGDVLQNAAQGALRPQEFRTACQVCDWPAPCGADITIGSIGVPSEKFLLIISQDENIDDRFGLASAGLAPASEYQVSHRETVVGAIADMRTGVRKKLVEDMQGSYRFNDIASFLAWFANCSVCGSCLSACPLYEGEFDSLFGLPQTEGSSTSPLAELVAMSRWLASCSGCGMCEQSCTCDVPLTLLISALSHRVRGEMSYRCGDPSQRLPWTR
jgi:formate dehydrogenase (coenzyme F420) beta subunit